MLRRLFSEVIYVCVERIVLEILEERSVETIRASLGCERYVSHLGEFGVVVEGRNFELCYPFRRRIWIGPGSTVEDVRGLDSVD